MSKFTFIREADPDDWETESLSTVTISFTDYRLDRMLEEFENFLRASGFVFAGMLEINDGVQEEVDELDDLAQWFDGKSNKKVKNK